MDVETTLLSYRGIKNLHVGAVAVSLCLFALRGVWMMRGSVRLQERWVKIVPHVVDTLLLASAIWLAIQLLVMPLRDAWLTAKVAGLIAYVVLGSIALKRGRTPAIRIAAFAGALLVFAYIVAVAWTKQPAVIG